MLQTFVCWAWIFITAYLTGFAVRRILGRWSPGCDMDLVFGLCILTVYAQVFSLFLPVSLAATILLGGICLVIVIAFQKALFETLGRRGERRDILCTALSACCLCHVCEAVHSNSCVIGADAGIEADAREKVDRGSGLCFRGFDDRAAMAYTKCQGRVETENMFAE